ncbi:IS66 family insertion sequence element accessory protein TnpB [Bradyrhizobium sp. 153]|uniref:IS66 family insertion sequence element accessory protein TnpB n=1 Tax=Bradyrhizobium sp. 153 TaxID=2782627 RepID=UPI0031FA12C6
MIPVPTGVRVWLATGHTDMRKGIASLSLQVQEVLRRDPLSGHLFCFRGRRGDLLKMIWHDGQGTCPFRNQGIREIKISGRPTRPSNVAAKRRDHCEPQHRDGCVDLLIVHLIEKAAAAIRQLLPDR